MSIILGSMLLNTSVTLADDTYPSEKLPFGSKNASALVDKKSNSLSLKSMYMLDLGHSGPVTIIIASINIILTFLGAAGLVVLLYAGVLWMTARGNSEQIETSKNLLRRGVIGLIIILMASAINILVFYTIQSQFYASIG